MAQVLHGALDRLVPGFRRWVARSMAYEKSRCYLAVGSGDSGSG